MSKGHKGPNDSDLLVQLFNDEAYSVKVFQQIFKYIRTLIHTEQDAYEHKVSRVIDLRCPTRKVGTEQPYGVCLIAKNGEL